MTTAIIRVPGLRSVLAGAWLLLGASASCAGGNAARQPCPADAWAGKCKLTDLRKVEERELPMPYVVYEAVYAPQANARYPQFTPAEVRVRFGTPARHEFALIDHVKPQAEVDCRAPAMAGSCQPQEVIASVIPFDAERAPEASVPHQTGCAAIDAASEQDRLAKSRSEASVLSERFSFEADSATPSPEAPEVARAVAKRLNEDPSLECLGLVGQISPGEPTSLAEARARAIKRLLISLGVDGKRLLTIGVTASVYGAGAKAQAPEPEPEKRRVSLSVLLKTEATPRP